MIKTALSRKRTRAVYFFLYLSLWIHSWEGERFDERAGGGSLFLSRCAFGDDDLKTGLTISGTKQPALCYDYLNFWAEETKRAREENNPLPREKEREIQKNTRSALLRPSLLRAKFSDDDVKKSSIIVLIWCSKWLKVHYLLSRKAERTKIDRTTKRQHTARVKGNFHTTKILIF